MGKSNISDAILFVLGSDQLQGTARRPVDPPLLQRGGLEETGHRLRGLPRLRQLRPAAPGRVGGGRDHPLRQARAERPERLLLVLLRQRPPVDPGRDRRDPLPRTPVRRRLQPRPAGRRQPDRQHGAGAAPLRSSSGSPGSPSTTRSSRGRRRSGPTSRRTSSRIQTLLGEIKNHICRAGIPAPPGDPVQADPGPEAARRGPPRPRRPHAGPPGGRQLRGPARSGFRPTSRTFARRPRSSRTSGRRPPESIDRIEQEIAQKGGAEAAKFKQQLDERRMAFARLEESVSNADAELKGLAERAETLTEQVKASDQEAKRARGEGEDARRATRKGRRGAPGEGRRAEDDDLGGRPIPGQAHRDSQGDPHRRARARGAPEGVGGCRRRPGEREGLPGGRRTRPRPGRGRPSDAGARAQGRRASGRRSPSGPAARAPRPRSSRRSSSRSRRTRGRCARRPSDSPARSSSSTASTSRSTPDSRSGRRRAAPASQLAAVDFLLSQRNLGKIAGIRGTVQELARLRRRGHETALTVAAGNRFQALVVETDQVAEECIKLLRHEKRGRATFLPLNKMLPGRPKGKSLVAAQSDGALGFAIDLVQFDEELRPAFWYVFGETVVMEDLGRARTQMGGVRLVTLAGRPHRGDRGDHRRVHRHQRAADADTASELKRLGEELREKSGAEAAAKSELERLSTGFRTVSEELAKRSGRADATEARPGPRPAGARGRSGTTARNDEADRRARSRQGAGGEVARQGRRGRRAPDRRDRASSRRRTVGSSRSTSATCPASLSKRIQALQEANQAAHEERLQASREIEGVRASLAAASKSLEERRGELSTLQHAIDEKTRALVASRKSRDAAKESLEALRTVEAKQLSPGPGPVRREADARGEAPEARRAGRPRPGGAADPARTRPVGGGAPRHGESALRRGRGGAQGVPRAGNRRAAGARRGAQAVDPVLPGPARFDGLGQPAGARGVRPGEGPPRRLRRRGRAPRQGEVRAPPASSARSRRRSARSSSRSSRTSTRGTGRSTGTSRAAARARSPSRTPPTRSPAASSSRPGPSGRTSSASSS